MFKNGSPVNIHFRGVLDPIPGIVTSDAVNETFENRAGQLVRTTLFEVVSYRVVPQGRPGAGLTSYRRSMESLGFLSARFTSCPELDHLSPQGREEEIAKSITRFQNPSGTVDAPEIEERDLIPA
jgi:hypothetical protein